MSWQLFTKVIDELNNSFENLRLGMNFGGESLLHPQFTDMLEYVKSTPAFKEVGFNTNGTLLNNKIMAKLLYNELDWIKFSLEGLGPVNDLIRQMGSYEIVARKIRLLRDMRDESRSAKPRIMINLTKSTQTETQILEFAKYWTKHVDAVFVSPSLDEHMRLQNGLMNDMPTIESPFCTSPFGYMGILWNGSVVTCCGDWNGVNTIGNAEKQSLYEIWFGRRFRQLRYQHLKHNHDPSSLCTTCDWWKNNFEPRTESNGDITIKFYGHTQEYTRRMPTLEAQISSVQTDLISA
jgi:MoaA/NifB/PqqE/SkfB family radical SAM enzyme